MPITLLPAPSDLKSYPHLRNAWNIIPLYCLTDIVQSNADNSYLENAFSDPSRHSVEKSEFQCCFTVPLGDGLEEKKCQHEV